MNLSTALNLITDNYALFTVLKLLLGFVGLAFLYMWRTYNVLVRKLNQIKNDLSDILVELKRRTDLIDQLASMVKAYAKHEKSTFTEVTKARNSLNKSSTIKQTAEAENVITDALKSVFAVVENYPKLQAQENYKSLMKSLEDTENRIAQYREEYNLSVLRYNNSVLMFPSLIIARLFQFKEEAYYKIDA